ncbi:MAG TPA: hypothetical protein VEO54_19905 [Thermoanaerobaculia bacterium]|nr:hypothetical protein [Thermoanaerobaculia bacterium]
MFHRTLVRLALACLALALASRGEASTVLFGPATYAPGTGQPQTHSTTFAGASGETCGGEPMFVLVAENRGVASAVVVLNGTTLLSERDFPGAALREIPVALGDTNQLAVTIKGGARDASLRLSIERRVQETSAGPASVSSGATVRTTFDAAGGSMYRLLVRNNGAANANVTLNGTAVLTLGPGSASALRTLAAATGSNELAFSVSGGTGSSIEWTLFRDLGEPSCAIQPTIAITAPADGTDVVARRIVVTGTATGPRDLGIVVNGVPAQLDLTAAGTENEPYPWFASVDAAEGATVITATASTPAGHSATDTRNVTFTRIAEPVTLVAAQESGVPPFTAHFNLLTSLDEPVTSYAFDLDGDGSFETSTATLPDSLGQTYTTPGLRTVRAKLTTASGAVHTASTLVTVQPFPVMDAVLRAAWTRFTGAMASGNAAAATAQLAGKEAQAKYGPSLAALGARLPAFAASIQTIHAIWIRGNAAHYLLVRDENGSAYGYHVYFVRGASDGVWRVIQF